MPLEMEVSCMYLSFDVLARELSRNLSVQTYNVAQRQVISDIQVLPLPFRPGQQELKSETAYLCNYWQLKQLDPHMDLPPIICVVERYVDSDPIFFQNRAVIAVYGSTLTDTLLALLNSTYDLGCKSSLATEVSRSLLKCRSIPELMEEGFRALKSPILVTDQEQKILYCTSPERVSSPIYRDFFISEYLPVGHPNTELDTLWHPVSSLVATDGDGQMPPVLYKALMIGGTVIGYLHILQLGRPFDEQDLCIAELLGNLLTVSLWHQQGSRPKGRVDQTERFLRDILDNLLGSPETVLQRQKELGITFQSHLYALVFTLRDISSPHRVSFSDLASTVQRTLPGCRSFLYQNIVFALVSAARPIRDFGKLLSPLIPSLRQYDLVVGISNEHASVVQLRGAGYQASKAIELGSRIHPDALLYPYREYSIYYMSELCLKNDALPTLCLPELIQLMEYCKNNGPELLDTLRAYLSCDRSKSAAAERLSVHVNTVKYRITQIQELTGLNLRDDETAMLLMLSFRLLEYQEKFHGPTKL